MLTKFNFKDVLEKEIRRKEAQPHTGEARVCGGYRETENSDASPQAAGGGIYQ